MKPEKRNLILSLCCVFLGPAQAAIAAQVSLPLYTVAYTASYSFGILTFTADTDTSISWDDQSGEYLYSTRFEANGVASWKFPGIANDRGRFKLDCRGIVPVENLREDGSDKLEEDLVTEFDATGTKAKVLYRGENLEFDLSPGTVDPQLLSLAVMLDMQQGLPVGTYLALDRTKIKPYPFRAVGEETLDTRIGKYATLVLQEGNDTDTRTRKVWVVPELGYLPVKIEYRKKGKTQAITSIDSLVRNGQGPQVDCEEPPSNAQPVTE
jgi:hypothetical protein